MIPLFLIGSALLLSIAMGQHHVESTAQRLIRGKWFLNRWVNYHTLLFNADSTVVIDNAIDTIYRYRYVYTDGVLKLRDDAGKVREAKIVSLSADTLILANLLDSKRDLGYSRVRRKMKFGVH